MTKRRGVYVTKSERVITYARHGNRIAAVTEYNWRAVASGHWRISIHPPSRKVKRQHLRCSCGWSRSQPYPLVNGLIVTCPHVEALLRGEVIARGGPPLDPTELASYHMMLTQLGARLFAWKIAERALAESRP